ncbi:HAD family hydrolase [Ketobacter sp.]|uniref:HAD family hydrolase n=1 Tax=Ketobacter sp. TaxID=2083498 RepID=UPI000F20C12B|nr:HAD-IA family hydrolase [Ketobacter sp.]RLT92517.1 MAG: HAD family hydrolase [Ketobacter sp.]
MPDNAVPCPIAAVLFDLDGTLIDTAPDFVRIVNQMRLEHQLAPFPPHTIRQQVSNGARALVTLAFGGEESNPDFTLHLDALLQRYEQELAVESHLFDGLDTALQALEARNIPWGIVTNKPSRYTDPLLVGLNLHQRCAVAICPDQVTHRKPHPEPILTACERIGADPSATLYVGDHARDIEAGKRANNYTVAAGWGYLNAGERAEDWCASITLPTPQTFCQWLSEQL